MTKHEVLERLLDGEALDSIFQLSDGQDCEIYKAEFFSAGNDIIYIPDFSLNNLYGIDEGWTICDTHSKIDDCYTGNDFIEECKGDFLLAQRLFEAVDWQHPSSVLLEDWFFYDEEEQKEFIEK